MMKFGFKSEEVSIVTGAPGSRPVTLYTSSDEPHGHPFTTERTSFPVYYGPDG